jgi:diguanylate cyclase (GGDEF)-like protein/PAS domain S-box-containing protein
MAKCYSAAGARYRHYRLSGGVHLRTDGPVRRAVARTTMGTVEGNRPGESGCDVVALVPRGSPAAGSTYGHGRRNHPSSRTFVTVTGHDAARILAIAHRKTGLDDATLSKIFDRTPDAIIVLDGEARVCFCNPSASTLLGLSSREATGRPIASFLPDMPAPATEAGGRRRLLLRPEGADPRRIEVSVSSIDVVGARWRILLIARPAEHQPGVGALGPVALYDDLTRLPGRALFTDRLEHAVNEGARRRSSVAVLLLDIDRFMDINATLGHKRGDDVLRAVAERLRGDMRTSDTLARFGEDQFGVLVRGRPTPAAVARVADRIQSRLLQPFRFDGVALYVTMTIGVALPRAGETADEIIQQADAALHHAKAAGPGRVEVFTPEMSAGTVDHRQVEADLRLALERNELEVFYQPQIRLADGALAGFEALVRWRQPGRGLRRPSDFIDVAATTGLIVPMGHFVLREACRQVSRWRARHHSSARLAVAVNLSATEILQPDLVDVVRTALTESGLPPDALELEITETAVLEASEETRGVLRQLKELGGVLAIDDWGGGYHFLSHLRDFPIDRVKIDRSFIAGLGAAGDDRTIVEAVVRLAHELGLSVVAEGVETRAQATLLSAMGCDIAQGFHYAPPLSARAAALYQRAASSTDVWAQPAADHSPEPVGARSLPE